LKVEMARKDPKKDIIGLNKKLSSYEKSIKELSDSVKQLRQALKIQAKKLEEETDISDIKELFQ